MKWLKNKARFYPHVIIPAHYTFLVKTKEVKYFQDIEILGWCAAGSVLPHGEKDNH